MGLLKKAGGFFGLLVDVRADKWLGAGYLAKSVNRTAAMAMGLFIPAKASRSETFEEAISRLNLTEDILEVRHKEFTRLFIIFSVITLAILGYSVGMFLKGFWISGIVSLSLAGYSLGHVFRYHFWLFQLKQRRLGCSFKDWWQHLIGARH